jgi:hypothetical protein
VQRRHEAILPASASTGLSKERLNPALVAAGGDQPSDGALRCEHCKCSAEGTGEGLTLRWAEMPLLLVVERQRLPCSSQ